MSARSRLRFLLLQVRDAHDPMRLQEVRCFAGALGCDPDRIAVHDLLSGAPSAAMLAANDVVLLGGSGDYSVAEGGDWLPPALDAMRRLHDDARPTFASCWGFQAFARALGGEVVCDPSRAELGTIDIELTDAGRRDPLFAPLGHRFPVLMGHQDIVDSLPPDAVLLASSGLVAHEAFTFDGRPIYCTQFHPELTRHSFLERVAAYPRYVERIAGTTVEQFNATVYETPIANRLLSRFIDLVFGTE